MAPPKSSRIARRASTEVKWIFVALNAYGVVSFAMDLGWLPLQGRLVFLLNLVLRFLRDHSSASRTARYHSAAWTAHHCASSRGTDDFALSVNVNSLERYNFSVHYDDTRFD